MQTQRGRPWNVGTREEEEVEEEVGEEVEEEVEEGGKGGGMENEENEGNLRRNGGQNTEREDEKVL